MSPAPPPKDEALRLHALRKTGLLDSAPEVRFDRITRLAAQFFRVETCLVSLVDSERQWFKSRVGLQVDETHRDHSFCAHTILGDHILEIPDARNDPRFADNPLVTGPPHIRFYAGAPLITRSGYRLGSLCLIDPAPRQLSSLQHAALRDFADCIEHEIETVQQADMQRRLNATMARTNAMLSTLPDMVFVVNREHRFVACNEHPDLLMPTHEILGKTPAEVLPSLLAEQLNQHIKQAFTTNQLINSEFFLAEHNQYFEARLHILDREEILILVRNITQEKRDAERLHNSENLLKAVIDANSIGTWQLDLQTEEMLVNNKWASLIGYDLEELGQVTYDTWKQRVHPDDLAYCLDIIDQHAHGDIPLYEANLRIQHKDGHWIWINSRGRITTFTADGQPETMLGTHFDISAQVQTENSLQEQSQHMEVIVEHMLDGIISINGDGTIQSFNPAAEQIFGYSYPEVLGKNVNILMPEPHRSHHDSYIHNYMGSGLGGIIGKGRELEGLHKDGHRFPIEIGIAEVKQEGERLFIGMIRDITERKKGEDEIRQLAFYDGLTQLPNRRLLLDRLQQAIANADRHQRHSALLFLDLDNFKSLNDSAGHGQGDRLLQQVANRLTQGVRKGDTVARLSGDEFIIMLEELSVDNHEAANQAEVVAEKLLSEINRSFTLEGLDYRGSASIGITLFNDHCASREDLLKQADMAMYKAKAAGRNSIHFFDPQMQVAVTARAALEQDLHAAIRQQQFCLHYQIQVDDHGCHVGAEVLLRWQHPERGMVSPADFIPLTEETGLIVPIGEWVLEQACQTLASWGQNTATAELCLAVNISVVQFRRGDLVRHLLQTLQKTGANPQRLKLEITESLLANNLDEVVGKMRTLRQQGISFSIDDFGTGYSSLAYLKQLPINQLKIDQRFVRDLLTNSNDQAIAEAIITLAKAMQLDVIAEGVETEAQREKLLQLGCRHYQGYLFGRPAPLDEFRHALSQI
ncbi:MAG: EAL domain-containing protein [Pseudomonadaceae bacterium]|nr:MAG: EAL domain-containing protein [Pseudomonadaceae bacterium]